jgi:hypothetical protein
LPQTMPIPDPEMVTSVNDQIDALVQRLSIVLTRNELSSWKTNVINYLVENGEPNYLEEFDAIALKLYLNNPQIVPATTTMPPTMPLPTAPTIPATTTVPPTIPLPTTTPGEDPLVKPIIEKILKDNAIVLTPDQSTSLITKVVAYISKNGPGKSEKEFTDLVINEAKSLPTVITTPLPTMPATTTVPATMPTPGGIVLDPMMIGFIYQKLDIVIKDKAISLTATQLSSLQTNVINNITNNGLPTNDDEFVVIVLKEVDSLVPVPTTPIIKTTPVTSPQKIPLPTETIPQTSPKLIPLPTETTPQTIPQTTPQTIPQTIPPTIPQTTPPTMPKTIPLPTATIPPTPPTNPLPTATIPPTTPQTIAPADVKFWESTDEYLKNPIKKRKLKIKYETPIAATNNTNGSRLQNVGNVINTIFDNNQPERSPIAIFPLFSYLFWK